MVSGLGLATIFPLLFPVCSLYDRWKADQELVSGLMFKNSLHQMLEVDPRQRGLTWKLELRDVRIAGSHLVMHLEVPPILEKRGAVPDGIPDVLQCTASSASSSSVVQIGTLPQLLGHWRSITSDRFVLIWLKVTIFSFGAILHYSIISNGFNNKAATDHPSVIQKEADELLAKGAFEH